MLIDDDDDDNNNDDNACIASSLSVITDKFTVTVKTSTVNSSLYNIFIQNCSLSKIYSQQTVKLNPNQTWAGQHLQMVGQVKTWAVSSYYLQSKNWYPEFVGIFTILQSASKEGRKRYYGFMKIYANLSTRHAQTCTQLSASLSHKLMFHSKLKKLIHKCSFPTSLILNTDRIRLFTIHKYSAKVLVKVKRRMENSCRRKRRYHCDTVHTYCG
jgi:hypothetical protein